MLRPLPAEMDCTEFVGLVTRETFGRQVNLPVAAGLSVRERDALVLERIDGLARPLGDGEAPRDGDPVVMAARGRQFVLGHHIGLFADVAGVPHVLHKMATPGVCCHRMRSLPGLRVRGVYRWL